MTKSDETFRLRMLGLPVIQDLDDLANLTHLSKFTLYQLSKNADFYYSVYTLPKKNKGYRVISQPSKKLKGLQSWILVNILEPLKVSNSCKGFEKGSSTFNNAEPHRGTNAILTIDLKDFFPSITQKQVFNIFRSIGYNSLMSVIFSNICTYKDSLPQGGPCSPKLANLSAWKLDVRIQGYVGKRGVNYTRYADDLSFSSLSPLKVVQIIPMIRKVISEEKFKINFSKTRVAGLSRAKVVTGLIIANDSIGIGNEKYKSVRAMIHRLTLASEQSNLVLLHQVQGWLAYLNSVDVKRLNKSIKYINQLSVRYPETLISKLITQ